VKKDSLRKVPEDRRSGHRFKAILSTCRIPPHRFEVFKNFLAFAADTEIVFSIRITLTASHMILVLAQNMRIDKVEEKSSTTFSFSLSPGFHREKFSPFLYGDFEKK
jgi:hypothetical protein